MTIHTLAMPFAGPQASETRRSVTPVPVAIQYLAQLSGLFHSWLGAIGRRYGIWKAEGWGGCMVVNGVQR